MSDMENQMQQLSSQVSVLDAAEESQARIQNDLVDLWKASCGELEESLKVAKSERDQLSEQLATLRH